MREGADQEWGVEDAVENAVRAAKKRPLLLQEDVDAAVENAVERDVFLVRAQRRIGRDEGDIGVAAR